jgi:hypothetical protein
MYASTLAHLTDHPSTFLMGPLHGALALGRMDSLLAQPFTFPAALVGVPGATGAKFTVSSK